MTADTRAETTRRPLSTGWFAAIAVVAANLLAFLICAPVFGTGFCADAPPGGTSVCGSSIVSPLQLPASLTGWIIASVVLTALAVILTVARHRRISAA